jgi:hypothetical protein
VVPSALLFGDTFATDVNPDGGGWPDVNHGADAARQGGVLGPLPYLEQDATASGGPADALTQVNDPAIPNTLLLGDQAAGGQNNAYVSPNQDFAAPGLAVEHLHVAIDPLGPGSSPSTDHWAALVFGTTPGSFVIGAGTGVLVRDTGGYALFDRGTQVSGGNVGPKTDPRQFYAIDFAVEPDTGRFTLSIDGRPLYTGSHGPYATDYVTLEDHTQPADTGAQTDYFADLSVCGTADPAPLTAAPDTTYYVSPQGDDANPGTAPEAAWRTVAQVNRVNFRPGDRLLFEGGATFSGNLSFDSQDRGTPADPVTVGSYGAGLATIDAGGGTGVSVADASDFTVADLRVLGSGFTANRGDGVNFTVDLPGVTLTGVTVTGVDVSGFGQVGVHVTGVNATGGYHGVTVTDSATHDNGYGGLASDAQRDPADVYVGRVRAYHNAGAGITKSGYGFFISGARGVVVEWCLAADNGWLPGNGGETGGIEAIGATGVLLQHNEACANHRGAADGDGIILDVTTDSVMQFNYTHDNDGGGLFLGAEDGRTATNNVVRSNVSANDARRGSVYGGIFVWQDVSNAEVSHNVVFMGPSATSSPAAIRLFRLLGSSVRVTDNLFLTTGGVPLVSYDGAGTDLLFQGNHYWAGGGAFQIQWLGTSYHSLADWRDATGQEPAGPPRNNPAAGGAPGSPDSLDTLTGYLLPSPSRGGRAGPRFRALAIAWDL